jgi:hypothetical protein
VNRQNSSQEDSHGVTYSAGRMRFVRQSLWSGCVELCVSGGNPSVHHASHRNLFSTRKKYFTSDSNPFQSQTRHRAEKYTFDEQSGCVGLEMVLGDRTCPQFSDVRKVRILPASDH